MKHLSPHQRLVLEDLLGDLWHARRSGDLGRLALLSYYEVRRWARMAGAFAMRQISSASAGLYRIDNISVGTSFTETCGGLPTPTQRTTWGELKTIYR